MCVGRWSDYTVCTLYVISVFYELVTEICVCSREGRMCVNVLYIDIGLTLAGI